jgi:exonuclease III
MVNLTKMSDNLSHLIVSSYNCRGFNHSKHTYIESLLSKCHILLLQEHWLADAQLTLLGKISAEFCFTGVSGFGNTEVLTGRPYGGCAILWQSSLLANVCPLSVVSNRVCAARVCLESVKLLLINVYMPFEDGNDKTDEFINVLSVVEDLIESNCDYHVVLGGDFNVDFHRDRVHTALLSGFCENVGLSCATQHALCNVDYTYNFSMSRFSILDHFILSGTLFDESVSSINVSHDVDNLSDHDPLYLHLNISVKYTALLDRVWTPRVSWVKASANDLAIYRDALLYNLNCIQLPVAAVLCSDLCCKDASHHRDICNYTEAISSACLSAAESSIPHTSNRHGCARRIPGWSEKIEPLREKSLFWHGIWVDCGRAKTGAVADCMRRTRAAYHYAIRQVKKDEECIVRERIAEALIDDPNRNFWAEIKRIRNNKASTSRIVDGCSDDSSIVYTLVFRIMSMRWKALLMSLRYDCPSIASSTQIILCIHVMYLTPFNVYTVIREMVILVCLLITFFTLVQNCPYISLFFLRV